MGKKLFVAEGYSLIDEERREGGMKNRSKWNLNTLLAERSTKERNMRAKTKSGSQDGLKSAVHSILCVSVDGEIRLKPTAKHCLISIVSLVSDTVSVENVSSTETLPTEGLAPEINQTDNNALLVSEEKVKMKVASEILPPKV